MDLAVAWLSPLLLGHAALAALARPAARAQGGALLRWATALPLGTGVSTLIAFAVASFAGRSLLAITIGECAVLAALLLVARRRRADPDGDPAGLPALPQRAPCPRWLAVTVALGLACAALSFGAQAHAFPFGDADGIAIWGNRAIFLLRAFGDWSLVFSPDLVHTDYPLLVPIALARAWLHAGEEPPLAGVLLAFMFTGCTFVALGASVTRLRGGTLGALATLALCATPFFAAQGAGQTGDVPVACFALLACAWLRVGGAGALPLAGCCAWLAAWTKNEGMLIAGALTAVVFVSAMISHGRPAAARNLARWLAGGLAPILAIACFKMWLAPRNDLLVNHDVEDVLPMLTSGERWSMVGRGFLELLWSLRGAGAATGCSAAALAALALAFWRPRGSRFLGIELVVVGGVASAEFLVFLLSPYDLRWHLGTALDRVLLQLWPLAVFGVFRAITPPKEAAAPTAPSNSRA